MVLLTSDNILKWLWELGWDTFLATFHFVLVDFRTKSTNQSPGAVLSLSCKRIVVLLPGTSANLSMIHFLSAFLKKEAAVTLRSPQVGVAVSVSARPWKRRMLQFARFAWLQQRRKIKPHRRRNNIKVWLCINPRIPQKQMLKALWKCKWPRFFKVCFDPGNYNTAKLIEEEIMFLKLVKRKYNRLK